MTFKITRTLANDEGRAIVPERQWDWTLERAHGAVICRSGCEFASEDEARSDIAAAKKSMKGAWRCKVVTVDGSAPARACA